MQRTSAARAASRRGPTGEFRLGSMGKLSVLAIGVSLSGGALAAPTGGDADGALVIHAGNVIAIPGEKPLGPATVVVRGGRIAEILPGHVERPDARSIDL